MNYINHYITDNSKKILKFLNLKNDRIHTNKLLITSFQYYKKYFLKTKTNIHVTIVKNDIKDKMINFYHNFIDENVSNNNFINDVNSLKNVYEGYIEDNEIFKFYLYHNDINYITKIVHLFNIFTSCAFGNQEKRLQFFNSFLKYTNIITNNKLNYKSFPVYIYPNNIKRNLISSSFKKQHLNMYKMENTAFTTSGVTSTGSYVYFTKKQELSKLQLHELIHLYKLDGSYMKSNDYLDNIRSNMPFQDNNEEIESTAEFLSNIYNCMNLCLVISKEHNLNEQEEIDLLEQLIHIEKEYSFYAVAKILKYFNVKPNDLFNYQNNKIELVSPINLYYIIRSIIYYYYDDLFINDNFNLKYQVLEFNVNIFKELQKHISNIDNSSYFDKINYYYYSDVISSDNSISYICLDINFDNINFENIQLNEYDSNSFDKVQHQYMMGYNKIMNDLLDNNIFSSQNQSFVNKLKNALRSAIQPQKGGSYHYKYLKYKSKYLSLKK